MRRLAARRTLALPAVSLVLLGIGLAEVLSRSVFTTWTVVGVIGMTVPVLFCWWFPIAAAVVGCGTLVLQEGFGGDVTSRGYAPVVALMIVSYVLGRRTVGRRAVLGGVLLVALTWASVPFGNVTTLGDYVGSFVFTGIVALAPWLAGAAIRDRGDRMERLTELAAALERERHERIRVGVALERSHIARELHDVLAHSIGMMVVQAEAAEEVLARQPDRAAGCLRHIQRSGREALTETRRVLSALRDAAEAPGLDRIDHLMVEAQAMGLSVSLRVEGVRRELAPTVDASAYRIVQEALSNVRRHSDAAEVVVTVRYGAASVELEVVDDGTPPVGDAPDGLGLVGMRERVERCGGLLWAGRGDERGFVVRAQLPLAPVPT